MSRRSLARYIGKQLFSSRTLNKSRRGSRGYGNLSQAFQDINSGASRSGYLNDNLWEENYTEVIDAQVDKAGNAGQTTLLGDDYFGNYAKDYCRLNGKDYTPEAFISYVQNLLGDTYYNAINEIIDQCAEELYEAWDYSYAGDSIGEKLFGPLNTSNRIFTSNASALVNYQAAAARRGYRTNGTASAARFNAEKNRQNLINRFGSGRTKAYRNTGTDLGPGYGAYKAAAARNGKIIKP